jgi:hypothetical protein
VGEGRVRGVVSLMLLFFLSCSTPEPEIVKSLRFEPPLFDSFKQNTYLRYTLEKPAEVSIYILNSNGERIKTIAENLRLTQGSSKRTVGKATTTKENSKQQEFISALL